MLKVLKFTGLTLLGLLLLGTAIGAIRNAVISPETRRAETAEFENFKVVQRAKRAVQAVLREPESARFGDVWLRPSGLVCGEVSARNGFGGMTGMKGFIVGPQVGGLMMEQSGGRAFVRTWNAECVEQPKKDAAVQKRRAN